jgi:hypothetical protein
VQNFAISKKEKKKNEVQFELIYQQNISVNSDLFLGNHVQVQTKTIKK